MKRFVLLGCAALLSAACGGGDDANVAPPDPCNLHETVRPVPPLHTPRWAFEPWISKDISTRDDMRDFVKGFQDRDIPVGVAVLDSPWETNYNDFVPNPSRYPEFDAYVKELHAQNIRIVLWITSLVNTQSWDLEPGGDVYDGPSPNFDEAESCGFFVNDATTYGWWKGRGAAIDFFDPKAVAWWHRQQETVFKAGIDGFKCDFGEEYITGDTITAADGEHTRQEYSEAYYRDFFAHGVIRKGAEDFLTMVRPWDESYQFTGRFYARPENAPVAWVGDNRRDWVGLADALDEMFRSAAAGYVVLGSDIGGYLDHDDKDLLGPTIPFDTLVFARWTAVGALGPFMQLHGRANISPWTVPDHVDETVALYRYWATLHHELVPFFYSLAELGNPVMKPVGDAASWPGDYRYTLGDALLVAPVLDASSKRDVALPSGARWLDFWDLAGAWLDGGQTLSNVDASDRAKIPVYVREGAIIPAHIDNDATGLGSAGNAGHLTLLVFPGTATSSFVLHDEDGKTTQIDAKSSSLSLSRATEPVIARLRLDAAPASVGSLPALADLASLQAAKSGWFFDAKAHALYVALPASKSAQSVSF